MRPDPILDNLAALVAPHRGGHRCIESDNGWFNENAGDRQPCPASVALDGLAADVRALHASVHDAAHDDDVALYVGAAAAGFTGADCDRAHPDDRAGFLAMGRYAIEALCVELDRDPARDARMEAVRARLGSAALTLTD